MYDEFFIQVEKAHRTESIPVDGKVYRREVPTFKASYWKMGCAGFKQVAYDDETSAGALRALIASLQANRA